MTDRLRLRDHIAHVLAVWFGCGYFPRMPGTIGTLGALPLYLLVRPYGIVAVAATTVVLTVVGIWAASVTAARTGLKDPQIVVIDEVAGVHVTWLAAPPGWSGIVVGFVLFRLFDQLKPWPARAAERRLPSGWGIVIDDIAAGVWGALVLIVLRKFEVL